MSTAVKSGPLRWLPIGISQPIAWCRGGIGSCFELTLLRREMQPHAFVLSKHAGFSMESRLIFVELR